MKLLAIRMEEIVKHINDTNASYRNIGSGDAKNTDLFLDNEHFELFREYGERITVRFNKENLQQAVLFIASILPRKYDNSAIHKTVPFSIEFVYNQLALLDAFFTVDGKKVDTRTQIWNARKDVLKKNGKIDNRFYFNGLFNEFDFIDDEGKRIKEKFTIRNYLAGGYSDLHIKKSENEIFDVWITNSIENIDDGKDIQYEDVASSLSNKQLQQIFYGAPGTGKSHTIKKETKGEDVIRTTFHPDSDYSTFVGAYKPTTIEEPVMTVIGTRLVPVENAKPEKKIIYEFVSQAFLQAYVKAWIKYAEASGGNPKKQFLVIEEINRGNCAQIFGDLFQLLDRNDKGFSDYPISADADMKKQLKSLFAGYDIENKETINALYDGRDVVNEVLNGDILLLPNNLYIWATMNTSDQSLFPIDSAFKRRWSWQYIPISNSQKGYKIEVNGSYYDWWEFLQAINARIWEANHSEDKKLGYFFAKADGDSIISSELFVGKVIFYLWNDVFKDFIDESGDTFNDEDGSKLSFDKFYETLPSGETKVVEKKAEQFLKNLGLEPIDDVLYDEENEDSLEREGNNNDSYSFNGSPYQGKSSLGLSIMKQYIEEHPDLTINELKNIFPDNMLGNSQYSGLIVEESIPLGSYRRFYSLETFTSADGISYRIFKQWTVVNIDNIIEFAQKQGWSVEKKAH